MYTISGDFMQKYSINLGIIMDGNGRWGKLHSFSRSDGHIEGIKTFEKILEASMELGIKSLSVYAFSTENWKRPTLEVKTLMKLFEKYIKDNIEKMKNKGIKLIISGTKTNLSNNLIKIIDKAQEELKNNTNITLNICFNYGSRLEIVETVSKLKGKDITEEDINKNLYALPELDLIIRTGGEKRLSNFMLWQAAYAELYFSDTLWPDFNKEELVHILEDFIKRNRRFGNV